MGLLLENLQQYLSRKISREKTAEVTASTWATFWKCGSRKRFKAFSFAGAEVLVEDVWKNRNFPDEKMLPTQMIKNSCDLMCQTVKPFLFQ